MLQNPLSKKKSTHLAYGIDTPEVIIYIFIIALVLLIGAWLSQNLPLRWDIAGLLGILLLSGAFFLIATGIWMIWSSFKGKLLACDSLLRNLPIKGRKKLLDVGCGRGFILIEAAKRFSKCQCVGIDNWSQFDLYQNNPGQTAENARLEGVGQRVKVVTADMQKIPFKNGHFDAVTAHLALHRIVNREGRKKAIRELVRVLKKGGKLVLQDFQYNNQISQDLETAGLKNIQISGLSFLIFPPVRCITAQK
jgi:arsenite methyltransferase